MYDANMAICSASVQTPWSPRMIGADMTAEKLCSDDPTVPADTDTDTDPDIDVNTDTAWFLYLLECEGNSIYTGVTTDVQRRYAQHVAGTGAKYTRARKPLRLLGWMAFPSKSEALKAEIRTKRLTPAQKRAMCGTLQQAFADVAEPAPDSPDIVDSP